MKSMNMTGKKVLAILAIIVCLWILIGVLDFSRVHSLERPVFCIIPSELAFDDGGSGTYIGLGYSFEIKGNFMPEEELPGVTEYTAKIFVVIALSQHSPRCWKQSQRRQAWGKADRARSGG